MDVQTSQNMPVSNKKHPPPPVFPKPSTNTSTPISNKENATSGLTKQDKKCTYLFIYLACNEIYKLIVVHF